MTKHNNENHMNLSPSSNEIYLPDDPLQLAASWDPLEDEDPRQQQDEMHHFFVEKGHSQEEYVVHA